MFVPNFKLWLRCHRQLFLILGLCWGLLFIAGRPLLAQEAAIKDLIVTNSNKDILVYFTVVDAFTPEMIEGVHNGIPVTFTFFVKLHRSRSNWTDLEEVSLTFEHTLTYDNLKEEYTVTYTGNGVTNFSTRLLSEAQARMSEVAGVKVFPLDRLVADTNYTVKVMARLAEKTLPMYIHRLLPIGSLWDFKTDWRTVEFRY